MHQEHTDVTPLAKAAEDIHALGFIITDPTELLEDVNAARRIEKLCHQLSKRSGWWRNPKTNEEIDPRDPNVFGCKLALVHSEVSEALEGGRKNLADAHLPHRRMDEVELADAVIRIFDLAGARGMDVMGALLEKLAYNQQRADHKPEARAAAGGKTF